MKQHATNLACESPQARIYTPTENRNLHELAQLLVRTEINATTGGFPPSAAPGCEQGQPR